MFDFSYPTLATSATDSTGATTATTTNNHYNLYRLATDSTTLTSLTMLTNPPHSPYSPSLQNADNLQTKVPKQCVLVRAVRDVLNERDVGDVQIWCAVVRLDAPACATRSITTSQRMQTPRAMGL